MPLNLLINKLLLLLNKELSVYLNIPLNEPLATCQRPVHLSADTLLLFGVLIFELKFLRILLVQIRLDYVLENNVFDRLV
mgnify:CR=1 FL=1